MKAACDPQSKAEWLRKFSTIPLWDGVATVDVLPAGRAPRRRLRRKSLAAEWGALQSSGARGCRGSGDQ